MPDFNRYEVTYRKVDGTKIKLCVDALNVTEAIFVASQEVPMLKLYPGRICSVIRGCNS